MKILNIKMNEAQERELQMLMENEGYTNKSEFIRYLMKFYKLHQGLNIGPLNNQKTNHVDHKNISNITGNTVSDENLSPRKRELLSNPNIFDEEVRQFIREMEE
ncbi:MAG: ribbon-helix-helix domain-containing protein [Candidatus Peregrinibacteria bacterium]|nr:ribbon-helix-helix domain-containing protein [Candidatus Peregrinibacteria bacterium]